MCSLLYASVSKCIAMRAPKKPAGANTISKEVLLGELRQRDAPCTSATDLASIVDCIRSPRHCTQQQTRVKV